MVVPHVGTWIEIHEHGDHTEAVHGRSPRGNVD